MSLEDLLKRVDEAGFTPGPWEVVSGDNFMIASESYPKSYPANRRFQDDDTGCDVAYVGNRESDWGEANARLIAAAPDMFEALKQVHREMEAGFGSSFGETREQVRRALLRALISQKEGVE